MTGRGWAAFLLLLIGCGSPATQVLVWIEVPEGSMVATRASQLKIVAKDTEGQVVLDETRRLRGDAPVQALPASISLVPKDNDATRTFEVVVSLHEASATGPIELMSQIAEGRFVADETREIRLRFEDRCLGVVCGDGRSCIEGHCERSCYVATPPGEVTRSEPGPCPCRCACQGDTCSAGACVPARPAQAISAGHAHACALGTAGEVWCWGENDHGQLGAGDLVRRATPSRVELPPAQAIAAGPTFSCVALADGSVRCFGEGARGQLGPGATADAVLPIPLALADGRPVAEVVGLGAGGVESGTEPSGHACAVQSSGDLVCWGHDDYGQLGLGRTGGSQAPQRVMTSLAGDGMAAVELGGFHTCARQRIGRMWCWGHNHDWQLGFLDQLDRTVPEQVLGDGFSSAVDVGAGTWHTCAVTPEGRLWCWGEDSEWRLGIGNPDGSDGDDKMVPTLVPGAVRWSSVDAGHRHTCAIEEGGALWCFGTSAEGEIGVPVQMGRTSSPPSQLRDEPWAAVSLGTSYTCGIRQGGALYCWGRNEEGQLGSGSGPRSDRPTRVCLP